MSFISLQPGFSFGGPLEPTSSLSNSQTDLFWMTEALRTAQKGIGISSPNPAVGCILLSKTGVELARGSTQAFGGHHAEKEAFDLFNKKFSEQNLLQDGTVYVTLEPCSHYGKQPPCVDLLVSSPLKRIVIAQKDPNPKVAGEGIRRLLAAGKEVEVGLLSREASAWNFSFLAQIFLQRPVISLKWAQTIDGQLADDSQKSKWITGPEARAYTHWLRQKSDCILVGAQTFLADQPELTARDCQFVQAQPLPLILDPKGRLLQTQPRLSSDRTLVWISFEENRPLFEKSPMAQLPNWVPLFIPSHSDWIPTLIEACAKELPHYLGHPLQSIFVEGGAQTHSLFLNSGYADLIHCFISPQITGGTQGHIQTKRLLNNSHRFEWIAQNRLGADGVIEMVSPELKAALFR